MADRPRAPLTCEEVADQAAGFVLGALEPEAAARIREHLATCTNPHPELEVLGAAVPALARSVPLAAPPPALGARIMAAARADAGAPATAVPERTHAREPLGQRLALALGPLRRPAWMATTLAAALAIVLGAWNLQLRSEVDALAAYRDALQAAVSAASTEGGQLAVLVGQAGNAAAGVAGMTTEGRVVVAMHDLAPTSGAGVYEAWLVGSTGAPVPIGSFAVGPSGTGTLTTSAGVEAGVVVAVTLEPGPGAMTPTLPILAEGQGRSG